MIPYSDLGNRMGDGLTGSPNDGDSNFFNDFGRARSPAWIAQIAATAASIEQNTRHSGWHAMLHS
jgi:hypothetical protein